MWFECLKRRVQFQEFANNIKYRNYDILRGENMPTISLCMIVKNEEEVLEQCLKSVNKACDEIVIVDTGSTDLTKEIARKFTDKIFDFEIDRMILLQLEILHLVKRRKIIYYG